MKEQDEKTPGEIVKEGALKVGAALCDVAWAIAQNVLVEQGSKRGGAMVDNWLDKKSPPEKKTRAFGKKK